MTLLFFVLGPRWLLTPTGEATRTYQAGTREVLAQFIQLQRQMSQNAVKASSRQIIQIYFTHPSWKEPMENVLKGRALQAKKKKKIKNGKIAKSSLRWSNRCFKMPERSQIATARVFVPVPELTLDTVERMKPKKVSFLKKESLDCRSLLYFKCHPVRMKPFHCRSLASHFLLLPKPKKMLIGTCYLNATPPSI